MKVKFPKNWKDTAPQEFYEGHADVLPDGQLKIKWDGIEGHFICDRSKVIVVDEPTVDPVAEVVQLFRSVSLSQIRQQLTDDRSHLIANSISRFDIIRSFLEAARAKPKNPTAVPDEG